MAKWGSWDGGEPRTTLEQTEVSVGTQEPTSTPLTEPRSAKLAARILLRPVKWSSCFPSLKFWVHSGLFSPAWQKLCNQPSDRERERLRQIKRKVISGYIWGTRDWQEGVRPWAGAWRVNLVSLRRWQSLPPTHLTGWHVWAETLWREPCLTLKAAGNISHLSQHPSRCREPPANQKTAECSLRWVLGSAQALPRAPRADKALLTRIQNGWKL